MFAYRTVLIAVVGSAGVLSGTMLGLHVPPASAQTYFERLSAPVCKATIPSGTTDAYPVLTKWTYAYHSGTSPAQFVCPVPDKSDLRQGNISEIRVDVDDWNNDPNVSVDARVCAFDSEDSSSGSCGDWEKSDSTATFTGPDTLVLESGAELMPLSVAGDPTLGETAYLWIVLPGSDAGLKSSLNSLYFEDD